VTIPPPTTTEERAARIGSVSTVRAAVIAAVAAIVVGILSGIVSGVYARNTARDQAGASAQQARQEYLRENRRTADGNYLSQINAVDVQMVNYESELSSVFITLGDSKNPQRTEFGKVLARKYKTVASLGDEIDKANRLLLDLEILGGDRTFGMARQALAVITKTRETLDNPGPQPRTYSALLQLDHAVAAKGEQDFSDARKAFVEAAKADIQFG
jgi:hypothetical protein